MKRISVLSVLIALVMIASLSSGCDNRSQLEKDADKAAKKLEGALK